MRLTIAIPTVNRSYCLQRALDSALDQTSPDIDVLVSNNASTDDTRALLDSYLAKRPDPRLRVIHHEQRMHVATHGAFLMSEARGSFFVGLSDDDWLEPEFAARVLALFTSHPELAFVYTRCWMHLDDLVIPSLLGPEVEQPIDFLDAYLAGRRQLFWCACVSRVTDLRRLGPQPLDREIGDMYFWTKLALEGPVGCVEKHLAHYTYMGDNLSIGLPASAWAKETALLIEEITSGLRGLGVSPERMRRIKTEGGRYLARSTANQFALNAQRGASKFALFTSLRSCWRDLSGDLRTAAPRVTAAMLLPRRILRPLLYATAARRARALEAGG
jgi:hypothetical protein